MTTGPVPPYQSAAPQQVSGLLIGAALTFGIAATQGPTLPAEYTFGTHTAVLVTAEAQKSRQWRPASGGARPRVSTYAVAGPAPFDPIVIQPQTFDIALAATSQPGVLGAEYVFGTHVQALYDAEARKSQQWKSARTPPVASQVATYQWSSPAILDVIQGWIETPTFNPQGSLMPCQDAGPGDLWALGAQTSHIASAPSIGAPCPLRMQWAAPQPMDSIQGWIETPTFNPQGVRVAYQSAAPGDLWPVQPQSFDIALNPQGPTIRAYTGAPSDPAPVGLAQSFTVTRAGAVPVTGPVRAYTTTLASPSEPYPPAAQSFDIAVGGARPVVATYQSASPRALPELGSATWQSSVIGLSPPTGIVRSFVAGPQRIDQHLLTIAYSAPLIAPVVPPEALVIVAAVDNFGITVGLDVQLRIIAAGS